MNPTGSYEKGVMKLPTERKFHFLHFRFNKKTQSYFLPKPRTRQIKMPFRRRYKNRDTTDRRRYEGSSGSDVKSAERDLVDFLADFREWATKIVVVYHWRAEKYDRTDNRVYRHRWQKNFHF